MTNTLSPVSGLLGYFHILTIVNNTAMKMDVQIISWRSAFSALGCIPGREIAASYVNSIFNFFRNCYIIFCSCCTILYFYQQCTRLPISPHPPQHLCFSGGFLIVAILMGMKWYFIVVLICISLMINDIDHLFMCLLAICTS